MSRGLIAIPEHSTNKSNLLINIIDNFGGPLAIITAGETLLSLASELSDNKRYQRVLSSIRKIVPTVIIGYKIYDNIRTFYNNANGTNVNNNKTKEIKKMMKVFTLGDDDYTDNENIKINSDIMQWLLHGPTTSAYIIESFFNETYEKINITTDIKGTYYILIKYSNVYFIIEFETLGYINNKISILNSKIWFSDNSYNTAMNLKTSIISEYAKSFNIQDNVIVYSTNGLCVRPKTEINYNINQFDVNAFVQEINNVITKKRKRGYIFAGVPGTGKSSIILKIEKLINAYPIIYISKSALNHSGDLSEAFTLIHSLSPCIVVFEDLDCYNFKNKNTPMFNEFLMEIDNVYEKYNTIIIATINDSSEIHESLINRPGRFDQVYLIKPPQTVEEVFMVMNNKYTKSTGETLTDSISPTIINKILKNKFTQADICEIIEKILINDKEVNNDTLCDSINSLLQSKNAIIACDFSKTNFIDNSGMPSIPHR